MASSRPCGHLQSGRLQYRTCLQLIGAWVSTPAISIHQSRSHLPSLACTRPRTAARARSDEVGRDRTSAEGRWVAIRPRKHTTDSPRRRHASAHDLVCGCAQLGRFPDVRHQSAAASVAAGADAGRTGSSAGGASACWIALRSGWLASTTKARSRFHDGRQGYSRSRRTAPARFGIAVGGTAKSSCRPV